LRQEDDAVTSGIRFIPFEFAVRNFDLRSDLDMRPSARLVGPIIGDGCAGLALPDNGFDPSNRRSLLRNMMPSERQASSMPGTITGLRDPRPPIGQDDQEDRAMFVPA
jgi:hypothetical protein